MAEWFYAKNGQQQGPVSEQTLQQLAQSGQLLPTDMVWAQGLPAWQPAGQTAGLFAGGPPPVPATPIGYATPGGYGPAAPGLGADPAARWLLPVGRSGWAIAAGYLGLLSIIIFPAPLALIISIVAIRDIKKHPDRHGMGRAVFGLVMGVIFSIFFVFMIIAMLGGSGHRSRF
jgi:hypothetical protein